MINKGGMVLSGSEIPFFDGHYVSDHSAIKIYDGYKIKDGQAIRIFKNAVEWTYTTALSGDTPYEYGNNVNISSFISVSSGNAHSANGSCYVTYTFTEPLFIKANQSLTIYTKNLGVGSGYSSVEINSINVYQKSIYVNGGSSTENYVFPSDTYINSIRVTALADAPIGEYDDTCIVAVTVNSDINPFILNNSGTSDNQ